MAADRILFVEENFIVATMNADYLRTCGFDVIHASSGAEAVQLLMKGAPFAALITDVHLGPGPTGYDLARLAHKTHPGLMVMITTGERRERHLSEGVEASIFIAKPYQPHQLVEALVPDHARAVA